MIRICFVIFFLLWNSTCFSQSTFLESFYTAGTAQNMFGKKTSDSGYILYGFNYFTGNNLFTKTDSNGIVAFSKYYNLPNDYRVYDAFENQNGYTLLSTGINNSVCFIKTDQNGMFISGKSYYSSQGQFNLNWLGQIGSDIYLYGRIGNSSALIKTDSSNAILWSKVYTASGFYRGAISKNNELYLGIVQGPSNPLSGISKFDSTGNPIWNIQFQPLGGSRFDITEESGVIVSNSNYVMKFDSLGTILWSKFYNVDTSHQIISLGIKTIKSNGYIIAGNYELKNASYPSPAFLLHIDQQGIANWIKTYGITNRQVVASFEVASDSGYVVIGTTEGFASTSSQSGFIFKTDPVGNLGCYDIPISITDSNFATSSTSFTLTYSSVTLSDSLFLPIPIVTNEPSNFICSSTTNINHHKKLKGHLFPNPTDDHATLVVSENENYKFIGYDIFGKIIFQSTINSLETELDFSNLPNGIYFYQLGNSENNFTGKFIVAH